MPALPHPMTPCKPSPQACPTDIKPLRPQRPPRTDVVTPGIRPAWAAVAADDQQRAATPAEAIAQGADYLVVGRPIRTAPDPVKAAERVIDEIAASLGAP